MNQENKEPVVTKTSLGTTKIGKILIVAVVMLVFGSILAGVGLLCGGDPAFSITSTGIHTNKNTDKNLIKLDKTAIQNFSKIDVQSTYADVSIVKGDGYYIEYKLYSASEPVYQVDNNQLIFKNTPDNESFHLSLFGLHFGDNEDEYVKITVPSDTTFETASINTEYGDVAMSDFLSNEFNMQMGYGDVDLSNSNIKNMKLENGYGDIKLDQLTTSTLEIEAKHGDVEITGVTADTLNLKDVYGDVKGESLKATNATGAFEHGDVVLNQASFDNFDCNNVYGDMELSLTGDESEYNYNLYAKYGSIELNNDDKEEKYTDNHGAAKNIKIETKHGDTEITTK